MVIPQPTAVNAPNPEDWCRPDRSARFGALIDGKPVAVDRVWVPTAGQPGGITPSAGVSCTLDPGPTPPTHISITVPEQDRRDE
jgi:hypothetical protein